MGDEAFDEKLLTEKLSKLNSSQQSIESLSKWCIPHRKKAKQVVETWEKIFKSAQHDQRVPLLFLSNDIMQNSRRKGSEFVHEFWKVLPAALKLALDSGHENCKNVASRLTDIWEERKVFGSRGANLKNELLGKNPSSIVNIVKSPNPIKVVKKDSTSLRIKLAVGGLPEKILTAFQSVYDDLVNEESALNKFHDALSLVQELENDVLNASSQGLQVSAVVDNIQKQEDMISQCISKLERSESIRAGLISQLREALQDQESKLEQLRSEISVACGQIEQAANIRLHLTSNSSAPANLTQPKAASTFPPTPLTINTTVSAPLHPLVPFPKSTEEESKKAAAAAVAAKLAASTSSAQMLSSILSSLVAEEAASMSSGLKRPRLDPPMPFPEAKRPGGPNSNSTYLSTAQHMMTNVPPVQPGSTQPTSQVNPLQPSFLPPPPSANQFVQPNMMGLPFGYVSNNLQPPMPSNAAVGPPRPGQLQPQGEQLQPQPQLQSPQPVQQPASGGFYRPIGIGFYGQSH